MKLYFGNFRLIDNDIEEKNIDIDIETTDESTLSEQQHPLKDFLKFIWENMKEFWRFARIPLLITVIILFFIAASRVFIPTQLNSKNNLVASPGATESAFLGYTFTPELVKAIKENDIDLYGLYVCNEGNSLGITFEESDAAVPGTAAKIKVIKIEYIAYSEEYMEKYFSPEYIEEIKARDEIPGYWNYTIDLIK